MMVSDLLLMSTLETLYMVFFSTIFSMIIGFPIGILLVITRENNLYEMKKFNSVLQIVINMLRSFPFVILIIILFPLARLIVGVAIGPTAAIVPLSIAAAPFTARIVEGALLETDRGLIEASQSLGADNFTIIFKVMIPESLNSLVHGITVIIINLIGYSAMAGTVGAGGLGDLAVRYGYLRFELKIMVYSVIIIIILVQLIQWLGNYIVEKRQKRIGK